MPLVVDLFEIWSHPVNHATIQQVSSVVSQYEQRLHPDIPSSVEHSPPVVSETLPNANRLEQTKIITKPVIAAPLQ